jgi:hypothetical protein
VDEGSSMLRNLRRALRPLKPILRPVYRRIRPRRGSKRRGRWAPVPGQEWLWFHEQPPERRISALEGRHPGSRILVVATGPSAKEVLPFDGQLHDRYDVVIGLNGSVTMINELDYFLSVESKAHLWDWYHHPVPPSVIRCVSESGLRFAAEDGRPDEQADRSYLLLRHVYKRGVDIRHYRNGAGEEGILVGPRGETRLGKGTVTLQAIHFASMLGASEIHLIGADLHFRGPIQHFYGQHEYGTHEVDGKRYHALDVEKRMNPMVVTTHPRSGQVVESTLHFVESASYIDDIVQRVLPGVGISVVDFSDGLLSAPQRGDFASYMKSGKIRAAAAGTEVSRQERVAHQASVTDEP